MITILAGLVVGLDMIAAAEFSFLLALPTLSAATFLSAYEDWGGNPKSDGRHKRDNCGTCGELSCGSNRSESVCKMVDASWVETFWGSPYYFSNSFTLGINKQINVIKAF
jgi:hypothetical protein